MSPDSPTLPNILTVSLPTLVPGDGLKHAFHNRSACVPALDQKSREGTQANRAQEKSK